MFLDDVHSVNNIQIERRTHTEKNHFTIKNVYLKQKQHKHRERRENEALFQESEFSGVDI